MISIGELNLLKQVRQIKSRVPSQVIHTHHFFQKAFSMEEFSSKPVQEGLNALRQGNVKNGSSPGNQLYCTSIFRSS